MGYLNCDFLGPEYAYHTILKQVFHSAHTHTHIVASLYFTEIPSEGSCHSLSRWLGQTRNDKPRFHRRLNRISPAVGEQFESLTYFQTGAYTLRRL